MLDSESNYSENEYYEDDQKENSEPDILNEPAIKPSEKSLPKSTIQRNYSINQNQPKQSNSQRLPKDDIPIGKFIMINNSPNLASSAKNIRQIGKNANNTSPAVRRSPQLLSKQLESTPKFINLDAIQVPSGEKQGPSHSPRMSPSFIPLQEGKEKQWHCAP